MNLLLAIAIAALAVFLAPSAAYASCGGGPSAQHVYSECVPGGSGGKGTTAPSTRGGQHDSAPVSNRVANEISKAGKDRRVLSAWVHGGERILPTPSSGSDNAGPSILGSAFDLGSGPLALFVVLAGAAALILAASGLRARRGLRRN